MAYDTSAYNIAKIRELLLKAFTPEDLRRFCQDRPLFRPIIVKFGPGMGLDDMVDRVIDYCRVQFLWDELLAEVKQANPNQYARVALDLFTPPAQPGRLGRSGSGQGARGLAGAFAPQAAPHPARTRGPVVERRRQPDPLSLPGQRQGDWAMWIWSVLATTMGWVVGGWMGKVLGGWLGQAADPEGFLSGLFEAIFLAAVFDRALGGIGQWLLLRHRIANPASWLLVSVALVGAGIVGILIPLTAPVILYGSVIWDAGARGWLLRRQVKRAGLWLVACLVAFLVHYALGQLSGEIHIDSVAYLAWEALLGSLYGALTGLALVWPMAASRPRGALRS